MTHNRDSLYDRLRCGPTIGDDAVRINWRGDIGDVDEHPAIGDAFYDDDYPSHAISSAHAGKRPICVRLPGNVYFCVYSKQITDGVQHEPGWAVSGEPDALTLQPSVNIKGIWHGFITNGAFSPDVAEVPVSDPLHIEHGTTEP